MVSGTGSDEESAVERAARFRRMMAARREENILEGQEGSHGHIGESPGGVPIGDISERVETTRNELRRIVEEYLNADKGLYDLVDDLVQKGEHALKLMCMGDEELARHPETFAGLEAIVRTDGSRPSFLVKHGEMDTKSSPVGGWGGILNTDSILLRDALSCVGRIDDPSLSAGFAGTGYLIHETLILTNRHVLQAIARVNGNGEWAFHPGVCIDFGHEFRVTEPAIRRALRRVVFCGPRPIGESVDHARLDVALIELESATDETRPSTVLTIDKSLDWVEGQPTLYLIGYPAPPNPVQYSPTLLEQLFQQLYGYKRLAPGLPIRSKRTQALWTVAHDATTLGGNSGSVVVVAGRPVIAAGLHYGGRSAEPAENWGHILGHILEQAGAPGNRKLGDVLRDDYGLVFADRVLSN